MNIQLWFIMMGMLQCLGMKYTDIFMLGWNASSSKNNGWREGEGTGG